MKKITLFLTMLFCVYTGMSWGQNYVPGEQTLKIEKGKKYFISLASRYDYEYANNIELLYNNNGTLAKSSIKAYTPTSSSPISDEAYLFTVEEVGDGYLVYIKNNQGKYLQGNTLVSTAEKTGVYVIPYALAKAVCCGGDVDAVDKSGNKITYESLTETSPVVTVQTNPGYTDAANRGGWRHISQEGLSASVSNWATPFAFYEAIDLDALNEDLNKKKDLLNDKIAEAEALLEKSGFSIKNGEKLSLQVTNSNEKGYLSSNADHNALNSNQIDGGGIAALIDNQTSTYFHTSWGANKPNEYHYIQVDLGQGESLTEFLFNYSTRDADSQQTSPAPTKIAIYGGNSDSDLRLITTVTSADHSLPSYADRAKNWQSDIITDGNAYRFLRFEVQSSNGPGNLGYSSDGVVSRDGIEYYFFCMSEFGLTVPAKYTVTNENFVGKEEQLLGLDQKIDEVRAVVENASTIDDIADLETAIEEITACMENFVHTVTIGDAKWSSLVLDFNASIPENVKAYVVSEIGSDFATLSEVKSVIPANEAVLLEAESGSYAFECTNEENSTSVMNYLEGTVVDSYIEAANDKDYYVLSMQDGEVGFYKAMINKNETGGEGNTHFLNNAFKAFLPVTKNLSQKALRFNFAETTGIETLVPATDVNAPIYDLSGRRVLSTVKGGVYIQNGKKFIVK